jgi:signal transduction histidine kinase
MLRLRTLTAIFLTAFAVVTVVTGYATFHASRTAIVSLVDRRIDSVADALLEDVAPGDADAILRRIVAFSSRRDSGDIGFELLDAAGHRLGGNVALARPLRSGFSDVSRTDGITGLSVGRAETRSVGGGLTLITVAETEPIDGYDAIRLRNYLIGFGLIAAVVLAGTATFGLVVRCRIDATRTTALAIIDGDLSHRVPVAANGGVFAAQAEAINRMLDRIATLVDGLRHVANDVAHDLRTPLARLRSRLTVAAERTPSDELEAAIEQCDELLAIFGAILRIAEIDTGDRRSAFGQVALHDLAGEVVDTLSDAAQDEGRTLATGILPAITIAGDRQLLSQALYNLVENALHHTPPGTRVAVSLAVTGDAVSLCVADSGPGIAEDDKALARRRFGRLEASRHRPGHGLGLPIVDAIARLHGGRLELADARPGLAAALVLPIRS